MPGIKRPAARIIGRQRAAKELLRAGQVVLEARHRRRRTQASLAKEVGISRSRLAAIEAGRGGGAPADVWFALGEALGIHLRFEFGRDPQAELRDAGHADIEELVLRLAKPAGWERAWEARSGGWGSDRSVDVRLIAHRRRRIAIVECWNTFGDLGEAGRSSDRKVRDTLQYAVAIAGDGEAFEVGLVWIVRDTRANRDLVNRYAHIFESRFPGSSRAWVNALTRGGPMPAQPGLIWCDVNATRLFARRRAGTSVNLRR